MFPVSPLSATTFNLAISGLGGWLLVCGAISALLRNRYYLSVASLSFLVGLFLSRASGFVPPIHFVDGHGADSFASTTLNISRIILGVQLMFVGVSLPRHYLRTEWKPLALLLGPGLVAMWMCSAAVIWLVVPGLSLIDAMVVSACIAPTDPILSGCILEGRFADENVPVALRELIVAESGANDGLGYLFLFLPLTLLKHPAAGENWAASIMYFVGYTGLWAVGGGIVYGWLLGHSARIILRRAHDKALVDRESLLVFSSALAMFILGTCGILGVDDVLACFVAGNALTWDDWFRLQTLGDSFQHSVDKLLNIAVYMWIGARCPLELFCNREVLSVPRLVIIGVSILAVRRIPIILASYRYIPQIDNVKQALFVGYFGPIGISAIFYLCVGLEVLAHLHPTSNDPEHLVYLQKIMVTVVWFLVSFCVIIHGLSVPVAKTSLRLFDRLILSSWRSFSEGRIIL